MNDDFRNIKVINPKRLIKSIKEKDYLIYDCFGGESRGMTTDDLMWFPKFKKEGLIRDERIFSITAYEL